MGEEMNTYIRISVQCIMGPDASVLHSAVTISHNFWTVCSFLCLSSTH